MSQIIFFWFEKCEVARYIKNGSTSLPRYLQKLKFKYFDIQLLKERHKDPWPSPLFVELNLPLSRKCHVTYN